MVENTNRSLCSYKKISVPKTLNSYSPEVYTSLWRPAGPAWVHLSPPLSLRTFVAERCTAGSIPGAKDKESDQECPCRWPGTVWYWLLSFSLEFADFQYVFVEQTTSLKVSNKIPGDITALEELIINSLAPESCGRNLISVFLKLTLQIEYFLWNQT